MASRLLPTGDAGLDAILRGGLPEGSLHLIQAPPGAGKTTLALQFLLEGLRWGEAGLYVTLSQTAEDLGRIADSHGWDISGIGTVEIESGDPALATEQTIFQTADLRLDATRQAIEAASERVGPRRMVYDSLLEVQLLARDLARYHREMMGLRAVAARRGITVLLLDTEHGDDLASDVQTRSVVHGIITLAKTVPDFGRTQRRIGITKMRGVPVHDGWHDMDIRAGAGVVVFPRMVPGAGSADEKAVARSAVEGEQGQEAGATPGPGGRALVRSGVERLDALLGGGLEPGTTALVMGQAGTGKSTVAALYAAAALGRGERVVLFLFEERRETFFRRCEGLGMPLRDPVEAGRLKLFDYGPDEISPGEFTQTVQAEVEAGELGLVVIDSLTGYLAPLREETRALFNVQSLIRYLARREILVIVTVGQGGVLSVDEGGLQPDMSFLGDTVLLLRMHEHGAAIRRSIASVKKRHGPHATEIRELFITPGQVEVGPLLPVP